MNRIDRDRALFERGVRDQLFALLSNGDKRLLSAAVSRILETQVAVEEIARRNGIEINDALIDQYVSENKEYFDEQIERAITAFICSVVSQEG